MSSDKLIGVILSFNPIKHGGWGVQSARGILKRFDQKFGEKKIGGSPHFSPSKKVAQENDPTMAANDPHFLSQNLFLI